ncbi:hypothetical protein V5799_003006 [Amblyomma americanum]|uniref:Uncharacterized protein n=1 Tax=Amblyomma americanum TaxID=6943 RepID=A0AAQ4DA66_AMBAM
MYDVWAPFAPQHFLYFCCRKIYQSSTLPPQRTKTAKPARYSQREPEKRLADGHQRPSSRRSPNAGDGEMVT